MSHYKEMTSLICSSVGVRIDLWKNCQGPKIPRYPDRNICSNILLCAVNLTCHMAMASCRDRKRFHEFENEYTSSIFKLSVGPVIIYGSTYH